MADEVEVISRAAGSDESRWVSRAEDKFTVAPFQGSMDAAQVILHLQDEHKGFLQTWQLRSLGATVTM